MLWVPQKGIVRVEHNTGAVGVNSIGTGLTTGGAASTKGTAVEVITSTAFDAYLVSIMLSNVTSAGAASEAAFDLLIGAATEEVIIANLLGGGAGGPNAAGRGPRMWTFPLYIPAGSRIAGQAASVRTSTVMRMGVFLHGGNGVPPFRVGSKVVTYGMGTVPNGTSLTPGASGAVGAFVELTSSSTEDHFAFLPGFQCATDITMANRSYTVELAIGASSAERVIGQWWFTSDANETMDGPYPQLPVFHDVPAGTRLSMRSSCSSTIDAAYNCVLYAVS